MKFILFVWTLVGFIVFTIDCFCIKRNFNIYLDISMVFFYISSLIFDLFKNGEIICNYNSDGNIFLTK